MSSYHTYNVAVSLVCASPSDYAVLPPRTLVPGTYVFTVTVSKGNLSSEASMEVGLGRTYLTILSSYTNVTQVEIITGNPPTISPIALQRRYNPDQGITVNGESDISSA